MKSISDRLRKAAAKAFGLRHMMIASSIIFFVMIMAALYLVYQNNRVMHGQITDDFNSQQIILARQAASQIDAMLHDFGVELMTLRRMRSGMDDAAVEGQMKAMVERTGQKGLIQVGFVTEEGRLVEAHGDRAGWAGSAEEIGRECGPDESGRLALGPLRIEKTGEKPWDVRGALCTGIDRGGEGTETLFTLIDVSVMVAAVTGSIRSGTTGYAWVIDEAGTFLYHPERAFVGKNAFTARKERKPFVSFSQIDRIMKENMLQGEEGTGTYTSGWHRGREGEIRKLIAFAPIRSATFGPGREWSVAVAAPVDEVAGIVRRVSVRNFIVEAALVGVLFLFGIVVAVFQNRMSGVLAARVRKTEEDLHETERIYRLIVEQAADLIYILDLDMKVVLLNRLAARTFSWLVIGGKAGGRDADHDDGADGTGLFIGRRLDELFSPSDAVFMRNRINRVLESRSGISYEHTIPVGGSKARFNTKLIPIRDDLDRIRYVLGMSRDVTKKMEVDQRIYNAEKLASIGTLAAGVAHEINNPLGVILGFTDLLKERFEKGSREREDLEIIEYNADHARIVVENLLTFARVTEGLEDSVNVKQSIEMVVTIVRNTLMTGKIEIVTDVEEDLPRVSGDAREFQQVLFNLINNAVSAMKRKGGTLTLSARAHARWVHLSVADTGEGIPEDVKPRIFDPFFTTKKVGEGTGLGLSLCYGIVKKYGGKITFTSKAADEAGDGRPGTVFTVSMPAVETEEPRPGGNGKEQRNEAEHTGRG